MLNGLLGVGLWIYSCPITYLPNWSLNHTQIHSHIKD